MVAQEGIWQARNTYCLTYFVLSTMDVEDTRTGLRRREFIGDWFIPIAFPVTSSLLLALTFPPFSWTCLAWIALVPFAIAFRSSRNNVALLLGGYVAGWLFHLLVLRWIGTSYEGTSVGTGREFSWIFVSQCCALVWPLSLWLGRRIATATKWRLFCLMPIVWISQEVLRKYLFVLIGGSPFPWLQAGTVLVDFPRLSQIADLGGTWTLTLLLGMINGVVADCLLAAINSRSRAYSVVLLPSAMLVLANLYGQWRLSQSLGDIGPVVCLMPTDWQPENSLGTAIESCRLPATTGNVIDVLLWPELALRNHIREDVADPQYSGGISKCQAVETLEAFSKQHGIALLAGCVRESIAGRNVYKHNSMAFVEPDDGYQGCYDKIRLAPGTEAAAPLQRMLSSKRALGFHAGTSYKVFSLRRTNGAGTLLIAPTICYDTAFPEVYRGFMREDKPPDVFLVGSRERAYRPDELQRAMLCMTKLRAIECRRPIVRNVNNGYSAVVDSRGIVVTAVPGFVIDKPTIVQSGNLDHRVSPYSVIGDVIPIVCVLSAVIGCLNISVIASRPAFKHTSLTIPTYRD